MVRTPSRDSSGLKKGTWTQEEDTKLVAYVTRYGSWNWRQLPRFAGLQRCGKSCRLRWLNYLRPNIKRGNYTADEDDIIIRLHQKLGNKWSVIATHLPGRTDNEIKNYWHTNLKKRLGKNRVENEKNENENENVKESKSNSSGSKEDKENGFFDSSSLTTSETSADSGSFSPQLSSSEFSDYCAATNQNLLLEDGAESDGTKKMDVWTSWSNEKLLVDNYDDEFPFLEALQPTSENLWTSQAYAVDMSLIPNELLAPFVNPFDEYFSSMSYDSDLWTQAIPHGYDYNVT